LVKSFGGDRVINAGNGGGRILLLGKRDSGIRIAMLKGVGFLCLGDFMATKPRSEVFVYVFSSFWRSRITGNPASGEAG